MFAGESKTGDFTSHIFTKEALCLKSGYLGSSPKCGENWNQHRLSDGHSHFSLLVCLSFGMFKRCSMTNVNCRPFFENIFKNYTRVKIANQGDKERLLVTVLG